MNNFIDKKTIRFECQGSSNCCVSRGSYGYVYLSSKDINKLASFFNLSSIDFKNTYCDKSKGFLHLKETKQDGSCQFLDKKRCSVYKSRPTQCRTWPFWSENMNVKVWNNEISKFCPGIGKGNIISSKTIKENIEQDDQNELLMLKD